MLIMNVDSVSNISFVNMYPYANMGTVVPITGSNSTAVLSKSSGGLSQGATFGIAVACGVVVKHLL